MKTSLLYNIISVNYIDKIKAKLLKEDSDIKKTYLEKKQKLEEKLDEETKILLSHYTLELENWIDFVNFDVEIEVLNLGIKIGMPLQKSFYDFEKNIQ